MSRRNCTGNRVEITQEAFKKIMSWSMALDEVLFLAVGKSNKITEAVRLINYSSAPRNYCSYSKKEFREAMEKIQAQELDVICMGHSHPHQNHLKHPSKSDWCYLPKSYYQMIVFPSEGGMAIWKFKRTYLDSVNSRIDLKINAYFVSTSL